MGVNYFTAGMAQGVGQGANTMLNYALARKLAERAVKQQVWANEEAQKAAARRPYEEAGIEPPGGFASSPLPQDPSALKRGLSWMAGKMKGNETLAPVMERLIPGMAGEPEAAPPAGPAGPSPWEQLQAKKIAQEKNEQEALLPGRIELAKAGRMQQNIGLNLKQAEWAREDEKYQNAQYQDATIKGMMIVRPKGWFESADAARARNAKAIDDFMRMNVDNNRDLNPEIKTAIRQYLTNYMEQVTPPAAAPGGAPGGAFNMLGLPPMSGGTGFDQQMNDFWESPGGPGYDQLIDPNMWGRLLPGSFINQHNERVMKGRKGPSEVDIAPVPQ